MAFFDKITSKLDDLGLQDKLSRKEASSQPGQYASRDYSSYSEDQTRSNPTYQTPPGQPPLPSGWLPLFDQNYQRWYYAETATGRTQWEAPGVTHSESRQADPGYYDGGNPKKEKGHGYGGMAMGAAAGLGLGAVGGALLEHARNDGDSSSDEGGAHYGNAPPPMPPTDYGGYAGGGYDNRSGSSDAESLEEAREDYQEALDEARDSDASSSEEEELEEAREEYEEEYEEEYDE